MGWHESYGIFSCLFRLALWVLRPYMWHGTNHGELYLWQNCTYFLFLGFDVDRTLHIKKQKAHEKSRRSGNEIKEISDQLSNKSATKFRALIWRPLIQEVPKFVALHLLQF